MWEMGPEINAGRRFTGWDMDVPEFCGGVVIKWSLVPVRPFTFCRSLCCSVEEETGLVVSEAGYGHRSHSPPGPGLLHGGFSRHHVH